MLTSNKKLISKALALISLTTILSGITLAQKQNDVSSSSGEPVQIPVGVFVTSLYDLNFAESMYSMSAWVWATYCPKNHELSPGQADCSQTYQVVPENYSFVDHIEIINAREWQISPTEQYIIPNADGSIRSMAKITAVLHQQWEMSYFPFDNQTPELKIESVEYESSTISFIPDIRDSLVSEEVEVNGWRFAGMEPSNLEMSSTDYPYPTSFGNPSNIKASYPRLNVKIRIEREGIRIFWTTFLGFFVSYIIIAMLHLFNRPIVEVRIGLIMSALFASVGNKYTVDLLLPPQSVFTFADLIQYATFGVIAIGLFSTIMISRSSESGEVKLTQKINKTMFWIILPSYPLVLLLGAIPGFNA